MSSRNKLIFLVIISILLSSLSLIAISESISDERISNSFSTDFIFSEEVDHNIVKIDSSQDLDENSFQDSFERTLRESSPSNSFEAIVSFSKPTSSVELSFLEMWDIDVLSEYSVIHSLHIKGSAHSILQLNQLQNTIFIEENSVGEALLFSSTQQSGVRKVWQDSLGYGYTGDSSTAIAILDTGVDDSHSDSNFNIIYWQDFAGVDYTTTGDEYSTPSDKAEHGTHCASIAASQGAVINNGTFKIQDSGFLPTTDGNAWFGSWFYVDGPQTVTLNYAWESGGTAYVGIYNETQWILDNYASASGSSPATFQVSLPRAGWYC
ncbi:MAG: S8 family serine peptidase, partial [Candidatus Heimdallarchaeota archaeon]